MSKTLIVIGAVCVIAGLAWPWLGRMPFGQLPGDIVIRREGFVFFLPITTTLIVSLVVSLLLWFFGR